MSGQCDVPEREPVATLERYGLSRQVIERLDRHHIIWIDQIPPSPSSLVGINGVGAQQIRRALLNFKKGSPLPFFDSEDARIAACLEQIQDSWTEAERANRALWCKQSPYEFPCYKSGDPWFIVEP